MSDQSMMMLANFWRCLKKDLQGNGVTSDEVPPECRHLPYAARVSIERRALRTDAIQFLDSSDFNRWAELSGLEPVPLRRALLNA